MVWPIVGIYIALTLMGLVFSFALSKSGLRLAFRILTGILLVPLALIVVIAVFFWEAEPPSLSSLQAKFASRQAGLNLIVQMSNEDTSFPRIAPDWLDQQVNGTLEQHFQSEHKAALPDARWNAYRTLFERNAIKLGFIRNSYGDVFIMADSIGLLNRGHTTGYLFCAPTPVHDASRYAPCSAGRDSGAQLFHDSPRQEAYSFQKIDEHWFVYDEGPS
jgi:hypothetical protein